MKKALAVIFIAQIILLAMMTQMTAFGEDYEVYVICHPKSFVWARSKPKYGAEKIAYFDVGDEVLTDGKKMGKWLHVFPTCEAGEGWLYMGYVVYDEPIVYKDGMEATTTHKNVLARRNIDGKINKKLKKNAELKIYVLTDEWAVTNLGFIKSKFLTWSGKNEFE